MVIRRRHKGFTLIELIVSLALFSMVMVVAAGAYLLMINLNRQTQALSFGINDLSFALETMARSIRVGTTYTCGTARSGTNCTVRAGNDKFQFKDQNGVTMAYQLIGTSIYQIGPSSSVSLTDSAIVPVSSLSFYVTGVQANNSNDYLQPYVTIVAKGTVATGPGKQPQSFTIETGAVMRGPDIGN